jgi:hypothetical protein
MVFFFARLNLKMEAMFLRNIGWLSTATQRYVPEDSAFHNHRCENLSSTDKVVHCDQDSATDSTLPV